MYVTAVSIPSGAYGTSLFDGSIPCPAGTYYTDHTSLSPVKMFSGTSYPASLTSGGVYNSYGDIWIDYNDDGVFAVAELVMGPILMLATSSGGSITILPGSAPGIHYMRVRSNYNAALSPASGCTLGSFGSTVDYRVEIITGTAPISGPSSVCIGSTITLSDTSAGGTWSSSNVSVATVGSITGIVAGTGAGTARITYNTGSSYATQIVTVMASPTASAMPSLCVGGTDLLTASPANGIPEPMPGGEWIYFQARHGIIHGICLPRFKIASIVVVYFIRVGYIKSDHRRQVESEGLFLICKPFVAGTKAKAIFSKLKLYHRKHILTIQIDTVRLCVYRRPRQDE